MSCLYNCDKDHSVSTMLDPARVFAGFVRNPISPGYLTTPMSVFRFSLFQNLHNKRFAIPVGQASQFAEKVLWSSF